ncbi:WD40 repeat domain-containing protein [Paenibacillus macerans]|uniref:WD40 repeat domain-containing protein n=1 Tax=Paenibacillus macerans TaxID=44252 RepID=UPI00203AB40E|nr:WD40 repeat domain-containing protein [Paenibacillus macerans]MCM3703089.1 WD40 repeat domain-containing protein [Paenibacillus macerans]
MEPLLQNVHSQSTPEHEADILHSLYFYVEAAILLGDCAKATQAARQFGEIYPIANDTQERIGDTVHMKNMLQDMAFLYTKEREKEACLRSFGGSLEYGKLQPAWTSRIKYFLAFADYLDYNVIDARRKLSEITTEEAACFAGPIGELRHKVEERSRLDFKRLRERHQAFIELGDSEEWVVQVALNPDATLLAVMYSDGGLKVIRTDDGKEGCSFSDNRELFKEEKAYEAGLAFSPDSRYLVVGLGVGMVKVYDLLEKSLCKEYGCPGLDWEQLERNAYYEEYTYVTFSATGRYLIIVPTAGSYDPQGDDGYGIPEPYRTFYCMEFASGKVVLQHTFGENSKIAAIQISPDERLLAVGCFGQEITVWDMASCRTVYEGNIFVWLGLPSRVGMTQTISFGQDSKRLAYAARQAVRIIHLGEAEGNRTEDIPMPQNHVCCALCLDSQDRVIFAQYADHTSSRIVRVQSGSEGMEVLLDQDINDVDGIYVNEEQDELWIYDSPVVQLRTYSTGEPIQKYDPYQWSYSPYMISNQVSIQPQASMVAISHKTKVRLG